MQHVKRTGYSSYCAGHSFKPVRMVTQYSDAVLVVIDGRLILRFIDSTTYKTRSLLQAVA